MSAIGERPAATLRHEPTGGGAPRHGNDPSGRPQLLIDGVEKRFGGVRALRGARLAVTGPGVVHGLIGANGSGKSTMLGILSA